MKALRDTALVVLGVGLAAMLLVLLQAWSSLPQMTQDYGLPGSAIDRVVAHVLEGDGTIWRILVLGAFGPAIALVMLVLWPAWLVLRRVDLPGWRGRLPWAVVGAIAAATLLESVHPILALPQVPAGPRSLLNHAFELVGYGFVNTLAYGLAIGGAVTFGGLRARGRAAPARRGSEIGVASSDADRGR